MRQVKPNCNLDYYRVFQGAMLLKGPADFLKIFNFVLNIDVNRLKFDQEILKSLGACNAAENYP